MALYGTTYGFLSVLQKEIHEYALSYVQIA